MSNRRLFVPTTLNAGEWTAKLVEVDLEMPSAKTIAEATSSNGKRGAMRRLRSVILGRIAELEIQLGAVELELRMAGDGELDKSLDLREDD